MGPTIKKELSQSTRPRMTARLRAHFSFLCIWIAVQRSIVWLPWVFKILCYPLGFGRYIWVKQQEHKPSNGGGNCLGLAKETKTRHTTVLWESWMTHFLLCIHCDLTSNSFWSDLKHLWEEILNACTYGEVSPIFWDRMLLTVILLGLHQLKPSVKCEVVCYRAFINVIRCTANYDPLVKPKSTIMSSESRFSCQGSLCLAFHLRKNGSWFIWGL